MVIGIRDLKKLLGISVVVCCAVFVCALFLNYNADVAGIKDEITDPRGIILYEAVVLTGKVVSAVSGGCLVLTSVVMLFFYIKNYIDSHGKELGILKAMGYSNLRVAGHFRVFGLSVLLGGVVGYIGAWLYMPVFYEIQNRERFFPDMQPQLHPGPVLFLIVLPTLFFTGLSVLYAWSKMRKPVLHLLREVQESGGRSTGRFGGAYSHKRCLRKERDVSYPDKTLSAEGQPVRRLPGGDREPKDLSFLRDLRKNTLRSRKILVFFVAFSSFCFASMTQMSMAMDELASEAMAVMMISIGLILAFMTLLLSLSSVMKVNTKTIAMMKVFGYSRRECGRSLLGGYRPVSYTGFVIGTAYQYMLLKIMVSVIFADYEAIPEFRFDIKACILSLITFIIAYEAVICCYTRMIGRLSIKTVMTE
ncbi:MAG: ABC transporter permease [Acetatifactor sp.]|nr:ABC transporter permease [Acetatifactor sp.]